MSTKDSAKKSRGPGKFINYVVAFSGVPLGFVTYQYLKEQGLPPQLNAFVPTLWTFEAKLGLLVTLASWISVLILINVLMVMFTRILTASSNPVTREDPTFIKALNRCLTNTLEQTAVFLPLLACWILNHSTLPQKSDAVFFTAVFIIGRLCFLVGYVLGVFIGLPTLRGYGFVLTVGPSVFLILRILGKPLF